MDTSRIERISNHHAENAPPSRRSHHHTENVDLLGAVQQLESIFVKAECDLSYVSRKLDTEFETVFAEQGQENINPRRMVHRIDKLRRELERLRALHEEVEREKQQFIATTVPVLLASNKMAADLSRCAALQIAVPEDQELLERLSASKGTGDGEGGDEMNATFSIEAQEPAPKQPAPTNVRSRTNFIAVSESEFLSVSELIRGRVKLAEVNQAYEAIFAAFKKDKKRDQLSVREMAQMGMVVTGATGEAKLKVLRALKLLTMAKDGGSVALNV